MTRERDIAEKGRTTRSWSIVHDIENTGTQKGGMLWTGEATSMSMKLQVPPNLVSDTYQHTFSMYSTPLEPLMRSADKNLMRHSMNATSVQEALRRASQQSESESKPETLGGGDLKRLMKKGGEDIIPKLRDAVISYKQDKAKNGMLRPFSCVQHILEMCIPAAPLPEEN